MVWWAARGHSSLEALPPPGVGSRALGALLGMAVGDALGAPLGGQDPMAVTVQEVDKALEMCGGGLWAVAPGQVTGPHGAHVLHGGGLAGRKRLPLGGLEIGLLKAV